MTTKWYSYPRKAWAVCLQQTEKGKQEGRTRQTEVGEEGFREFNSEFSYSMLTTHVSSLFKKFILPSSTIVKISFFFISKPDIVPLSSLKTSHFTSMTVSIGGFTILFLCLFRLNLRKKL